MVTQIAGAEMAGHPIIATHYHGASSIATPGDAARGLRRGRDAGVTLNY